jgi:hypothetical protein
VLPNPEAGAPLSHTWWLIVVALFFLSVIGSVIGMWFLDVIRGKAEIKEKLDATQTNCIARHSEEIVRIKEEIHTCQLRCGDARSQMLPRAEFDRQFGTMHDILSQLHRRIDQIAFKMGIEDTANDGRKEKN